MRRYEATREIMNAVGDELVVCNIGHPSQEVFRLRDRPENFYMLGSMGLASSIGLGLAMARDRKVVALDGDGSVTMNMGTLATIGLVRPRNYTLVIVDNRSYGSTGFQRSFTAGNLRLEEVARGSGVESVSVVDRLDGVAPAMTRLLGEDGPHVLVVKCEPGMPEGIGVIPLDGMEVRDRFMAAAAGAPGSAPERTAPRG